MIEQYKNALQYFRKLILEELNEANIYTWVAGGAVRNFFAGDYSYTDIDLYFNNLDEAEYCKDYLIDQGGKLLFDSENAYHVKYKGRDYDIIKHLFDNPQNSIESFDFTVCCCAVDYDQVYLHDTFFIDLAKKALVINEITYPLSTMWRMQKYIKKGYTICQGGILSIAKSVQNQLNEHDELITENGEDLEEVPLDQFHSSIQGNFIPLFNGID